MKEKNRKSTEMIEDIWAARMNGRNKEEDKRKHWRRSEGTGHRQIGAQRIKTTGYRRICENL